MSIQKQHIPQHIGIIMDGNGRWAKKKSLERTQGHLNGIQSAKSSVLTALEYGVSVVSLYVFSTENWKRPRPEVNFILDMVAGNLRSHYNFYRDNNIKVVHSGNTDNLGSAVLKELNKVVEETKNNSAIIVNLAFNYGGKDEIIRAVNKHLKSTDSNTPITAAVLEQYLDHPEISPVDLVIRTGGQKRLSNFLLWQSAYAEIFFSEVLWPDWNEEHMVEALEFFQQQDRRFGGISID